LGTGDRAAGLLPALAEPNPLLDAARRVATGGPGGVVFVAGKPGSGRTNVLQDLAERDHGGTKIIAGSFASGRYESWSTPTDGARDSSRVRRIAEATLRLSGPTLSLVATLGHVAPLELVASVDALVVEILGALPERGGRSDDSEIAGAGTVWDLLRTTATEEPTICILDDFDHAEASAWLTRELFSFAEEVRDLPFLLVASYEHFDEAPSNVRSLADALVSTGAAHRITPGPITVEDLHKWLGTGSDEVAELLHEATAGDRELLGRLWREWLDRGVVEHTERRWTFVAGSNPRALAPLAVTDRRIGASAKTADFTRLAELRTLLAWAALEGPVFTARALAAAMDRDPNELIDRLDEALATAEPDAVLAEVPPEEMLADGVWRYRFTSRLDWRALSRLRADEQTGRSLKYAEALVQVYGDRPETARRIAQLFAAGGRPNEHYRVIAEVGSNVDQARWQAAFVIAMPKDDWSDREYLHAARLLLAVFDNFWLRMPSSESNMLAEHARRYASEAADSGTHAEALRAKGVSEVDNPDSGLRDLTEARDQFAALGRRRDEITAEIDIAFLQSAHRHWDDAERGYRAALERSRATRSELLEGKAQLGLGELLGRQVEREAEAEDAFEQSVTLLEGATGSPSDILRARAGLAWIRWRQGRDPQARDAIAAHLDDIAKYRRTKLVTAALGKLAAIDFASGNIELARAEISQAISLNRTFDDQLNEALNWSSWGGICMRADGYMVEALVSESVAMHLLMRIGHPDDTSPLNAIGEMLPNVDLERELPAFLRSVVLAYDADQGASMRRAVETGSWQPDAPYMQHASRLLRVP
jgi:hypothetical protein